MKQSPPILIKRILRWFVNAEFLEEVEGDIEELFQQRLLTHGRWKARLFYILDVLQTFRAYPAKRKSKVAHEIVNLIFLKLAFRNLIKRKTYSLVNILGLGLGLVSFLLIMEYIIFEQSYDSFHVRKERIYRVAFDWGEIDYSGINSSVYASNVPAMGPALLEEFPEIESFTRFVPVLTIKPHAVFTYWENGQLKYNANSDNGFYADSSFLKIFSFSILQGDNSPLIKPHTIAVTESFMKKIFGHVSYDEVIGRDIEVDHGVQERYTITAILRDVPSNSHIQFDYLLSYATVNSARLEENKGWSQFYTYVLCKEGVRNNLIAAKFKPLLVKLYGSESHISIFLQPLKDIYLTSTLRAELSTTGSSQQMTFLSIIAYVILAMAWINYINMFLAKSIERSNEVGIKKILGSTRIHLIVQFFTESLIINMASLTLSVLILLIIHPYFETWLGKDVSLVFLDNAPYLLITLSSILIGCFITGFYPAFILSSYQPIQTLGSMFTKSQRGHAFKSSLVYFQFIVSFIVVSSTVIINRQINFMKSSDIGINLDGCVALRSPGKSDSVFFHNAHIYKDRLLKYAFIKDVAFTSTIPGRPITISGGVQRVDGPELEGNNAFNLQVDENFIRTYDVKLIAGRGFSDKFSTESKSVIVNEAALIILKFGSPKEALHHRIRWQTKEYEIVGVCANYNHLFLKNSFEPILLSYHPMPSGFVTLKIEDGYDVMALSRAKLEMESLFPTTPFEYEFLKTAYDKQYSTIEQFNWLIKFFAFVAILIACTGLFALSAYSVQMRTKEIAVRKVFGAMLGDVLVLLSENYMKIVILSSLIGSCITFYLMHQWLQNFAFTISLSARDFLFPLGVIVLVTILTVSYNCITASLRNPTKSLTQR